MSENSGSELMAILEYYDLGELVEFQRDVRGTVNTSFTIELMKDGQRCKYFFRRYKTGVRPDEISCEHSMIKRLKSQGFDIVAGVLPTRTGGTYIQLQNESIDPNGVFYAIFNYLFGEDRYTWIGPVCSQAEYTSAAAVLAEFHQALYGFIPEGSRMEPGIMQLLAEIEATLMQCSDQPKGTTFDRYLQMHLSDILENLRRSKRFLEQSLDNRCPTVVIHCDYHPGNLKFENEQVVGVFDLDWSKVDYRCFDVALAIFYFFVSWGDERDGQLRINQMQQFLEAYQTTLEQRSDPGPLTQQELHCLPAMIAAANLYVLNWAIQDYLHKDVAPDEYLVYLRHAMHTIRWLEEKDNRSLLQDILSRVSIRNS